MRKKGTSASAHARAIAEQMKYHMATGGAQKRAAQDVVLLRPSPTIWRNSEGGGGLLKRDKWLI